MTVPEAGFAGLKNGHLLSAAEDAGFDVFLSIEKGIQYQQNLTGRRIAVLIVRARSNRLKDLLPHLDDCHFILRTISPGEVLRAGHQLLSDERERRGVAHGGFILGREQGGTATEGILDNE